MTNTDNDKGFDAGSDIARRLGKSNKDIEENLNLVFQALCDPVRRAILTRLDQNDLLVSELAAPFDISLQAVSKHIQVLVKAGLVTQQRSGRINRCRLQAGPIYVAAIWINQYSKYWDTQFDVLAAALAELDDERREADVKDLPIEEQPPSREGSKNATAK